MKRKIVLVTVALTAAVIFTGCGGGEALPDYVSRMSGGSMQIDVAKASGGYAHVDEERMNIIYDRGDSKLIFSLTVFTLTAGIGSHKSSSNPPVKISPVITPGDDVADFFAAVRIDEKTGDLYVTVFIDTDWQEVVTGEIFLHTHEAGAPSPASFDLKSERRTAETVDFSKAVDGVYMHELRFAAEDNFGDYRVSPGIIVTNISGEPEDLLYKISRVELSMNHVFISISPQVVKPEVVTVQQLQPKPTDISLKTAPEVGALAPDFTLSTLDGSSITLSNLRGKQVLLNFWATWCGPCRAEMPYLEEVFEEKVAEDLVMLTVNLREDEATVRQFMQQEGYTFMVALDRDGAVANSYLVRGIASQRRQTNQTKSVGCRVG